MILVIKKHIEENFPFLKSGKLLLAISGGIDSVALAHVLKSLDYNISLAHVNFQLRGKDSDGDESFVKEIGEKWQIPVFSKKVETELYAREKRLSIQMAAREIRYRWFDSLLATHSFDYLLTAHHLDDTIETFFINLNRKSGLEGLTGIPAVNGKIVRPLLLFSRKDIEQYALENKLSWREDKSNATLKYERNQIRHLLFPVLEQINPDFRTDFSVSMQYLSEIKLLIQDYLTLIKPEFWREKNESYILDLMALQKFPNSQNILFESLKPYGFTDWSSIFDLMESQSGKKVLSEKYRLLKHRNQLILEKISQKNLKNDKIQIFDTIEISNLSYTVERIAFDNSINFKKKGIEYLDAEKVSFPLYIRQWQAGDYFYPLGMNGRKKLSDYFTDLKLSLSEKEKIWLLCDAQDQILWVVGYRLDNRFKVTNTSKNLIKISPVT